MNWQLKKPVALACALLTLFAATVPALAGAPADDLKQIEYKYYFRGKYPQAIEALQTFLARVDVTGDVALRAGEFLAASHVLSGSPQAGKDAFARLIAANPSYAGPDPAVFKPEVVDVYGTARSEYAALAIKNAAPASGESPPIASEPSPAVAPQVASKPIYKKWWFYAGAAALVGVVAGVASSGGDEAEPAPTGTLTIGVRVQ